MFKSKFSNEQPVKMSRKKEGNIPPVRPSLFCKQVDCRVRMATRYFHTAPKIFTFDCSKSSK